MTWGTEPSNDLVFALSSLVSAVDVPWLAGTMQSFGIDDQKWIP